MKQTCIMTFIILPIRLEHLVNVNTQFVRPLKDRPCNCTDLKQYIFINYDINTQKREGFPVKL